jgi:hypothetical protein
MTTLVPANAQLSSVNKVFVIVMSDQTWSNIKGSSSAPYINNVLLPMAATANNYFNPPGNHPEEPNYIWLEAGSNLGITSDNPPSVNHLTTNRHLVTLLTNAGQSWKTYQEGIPGNACPLTDTDEYKTRSNPFIYFDDITNNLDVNSSACIAHVRPYTELATDLSNNSVARYNFIKPSTCNSMRIRVPTDLNRPCDLFGNVVRDGDQWLSQEVPKILASAAYIDGGALFITWDQSANSDAPIGMLVLSPFARAGYSNSVHYTHGSTLRTFQEIFNLTPLLGNGANETSLDDLFSSTAAAGAGLTLSWSPAPGATSYRVKRATTNGGPYTTIATGITAASYTDRGLSGGTTYFYIVTAVNGSGESSPSAQVSATPLLAPPAPTNLTVMQTP